LLEAASTLQAYLERMSAVLGAVHAAGHRGTRTAPADRNAPGGGRAEATDRTHQAVIRLLEPEQATLRLPVEQLAAIFLTMLFSRRGATGGPETPTETLVDVFLNGVIA
jgi:hypothetical protein